MERDKGVERVKSVKRVECDNRVERDEGVEGDNIGSTLYTISALSALNVFDLLQTALLALLLPMFINHLYTP